MTQEHLIRQFRAPFSIFGWTPTLNVTVERAFLCGQPVGARFKYCHYDDPDPVLT